MRNVINCHMRQGTTTRSVSEDEETLKLEEEFFTLESQVSMDYLSFQLILLLMTFN